MLDPETLARLKLAAEAKCLSCKGVCGDRAGICPPCHGTGLLLPGMSRECRCPPAIAEGNPYFTCKGCATHHPFMHGDWCDCHGTGRVPVTDLAKVLEAWQDAGGGYRISGAPTRLKKVGMNISVGLNGKRGLVRPREGIKDRLAAVALAMKRAMEGV